MSTTGNRIRRVLVSGAIVAGAGLGAAGVASAASSSSGTPTASSGSSAPAAPAAGSSTTPSAGTPDPSTLTHGPGETLLTGTQLAQATAAANTAVPGATIVRAESNSFGASPYEVHMKKSDGTAVTVELDANLGVITTISGFGAGPAGGQAPAGSTAPSNAASTATA